MYFLKLKSYLLNFLTTEFLKAHFYDYHEIKVKHCVFFYKIITKIISFRFNNRVRVIKADARDFNTLQALIKHKADLVVSEMLGSFGDNELEPEVLEFIEKKFCHEKSILIPQKYSSYVGELF